MVLKENEKLLKTTASLKEILSEKNANSDTEKNKLREQIKSMSERIVELNKQRTQIGKDLLEARESHVTEKLNLRSDIDEAVRISGNQKKLIVELTEKVDTLSNELIIAYSKMKAVNPSRFLEMYNKGSSVESIMESMDTVKPVFTNRTSMVEEVKVVTSKGVISESVESGDSDRMSTLIRSIK